MNTKRIALLALAMGLWCTATAVADDSAQWKERVKYKQLIRKVREARGKLDVASRKALEQARRGDGQVDDKLKAEILSLEDDIERKSNRLELLAMRHGWDVPDFSDDRDRPDMQGNTPKEQVFGRVDHMIRQSLSAEAGDIAARVYLPVISYDGSDTEQ